MKNKCYIKVLMLLIFTILISSPLKSFADDKEDKTRIIYSFVTKDGKEFHIVGQPGEKNPEDVLLLTEVTPEELIKIMNDSKKEDKNTERTAFDEETKAKKEPVQETKTNQTNKNLTKNANKHKSKNDSFIWVVIVFVLIVMAYGAKKKLKKNKASYSEYDDEEDDEEEIYSVDEEIEE